MSAPFVPTIPEGWTMPPPAERPEGMRVLVMLEVEWRRMPCGSARSDWLIKGGGWAFDIEEGASAVHGFAPLPDAPKGGAA